MRQTSQGTKRMNFRRHYSLLLVFGTACGPGQTSPAMGLEACVMGWWQDPGLGCGAFCPGPSECGAADCRARSTLGLLASGRSTQAIVMVAASARTFSATTMPITGRWTIDSPALLRVAESGKAQTVTCTSQRLSFETASYSKVAADLGTALQSAEELGQWTKRAY